VNVLAWATCDGLVLRLDLALHDGMIWLGGYYFCILCSARSRVARGIVGLGGPGLHLITLTQLRNTHASTLSALDWACDEHIESSPILYKSQDELS
jgi:hypothetical protein